MEIFGDVMMGGGKKASLDELDGTGIEVRGGADAISALRDKLDDKRGELERRRMRAERRVSKPRTIMADDRVCWTYVIIDDAYAALTGCSLEEAQGLECLVLPPSIDGLEVRELGSGACEMLAGIKRVICAPGIKSIGPSAFRGCRDLVCLELPRSAGSFDSSWITGCRRLAELKLPGMLARIDTSVFEVESLEVLEIGPETRGIEPGAFARSKLREIRVDRDNPHMASDGMAIYEYLAETPCETPRATRLLALAVPCDAYEVASGCTQIGPKAFACCRGLAHVTLPPSLELIGARAFANTALESLFLPKRLRTIETRAFFRARKLAQVTLNEGLRSIGSEAFAGTALEELSIPASVSEIACDCLDATRASFSGHHATCRIAPDGKLMLDEAGVLYRTLPANGSDDSGARRTALVGAMERTLASYDVRADCVAIEAHALARLPELRRVTLPNGLESIGDSAFKGCHKLQYVAFPESLRSIGDEAFYDTALASIYLPACFEHLGELALVTSGARTSLGIPSISGVRVHSACKRFYHVSGLLCERTGNGVARAILYDGSVECVEIPPEVDTLSDYCFSNATGIRELAISTRVKHIGTWALNASSLIERVHVELDPPIDGHEHIDLRFPKTIRSRNEMVRGFNSMGFMSVEKLLVRYDACVVNMHDYDAKTAAPPDLYGQVKRMLERLTDPLLLDAKRRNIYEQVMRANIVEHCIAIARHDDREAMGALAELGFLDERILPEIIEEVGKLQDAAMTGYLLELQRSMSRTRSIDFDL